ALDWSRAQSLPKLRLRGRIQPKGSHLGDQGEQARGRAPRIRSRGIRQSAEPQGPLSPRVQLGFGKELDSHRQRPGHTATRRRARRFLVAKLFLRFIRHSGRGRQNDPGPFPQRRRQALPAGRGPLDPGNRPTGPGQGDLRLDRCNWRPSRLPCFPGQRGMETRHRQAGQNSLGAVRACAL
ncbi:uncharacterized protein METZ01_LOCUS285130, partial [marine metagenome]